MGRPAIDLTGKTFGRLTVVARDVSIRGGSGRHAKWHCVCECGNASIVASSNLTRSDTVSCGCYGRERIVSACSTHGMSATRIFRLWSGMINRCRNEADRDYPFYGGRGIKVCDAWMDFATFYSDMGEKPAGKSLDRIDNLKGYSPENCRWATAKEQANNRRNTRFLKSNGQTKRLVEWAEELGLSQKTIHTRLFHGWTHEDALRPSQRK